MATLDALRKLFEEATSRVGDVVTEYERTPSPSAGEARELFGLPPAKGRVVAPPVAVSSPAVSAPPSEGSAFNIAGLAKLRNYSPDWTRVSDDDLETAFFAEENPPVAVQREFERRGRQSALLPNANTLARPSLKTSSVMQTKPLDWTKASDAQLDAAVFGGSEINEEQYREMARRFALRSEDRERIIAESSKPTPTRTLVRPPTVRRQVTAPAPAAPSAPAPVVEATPAPAATASASVPKAAAVNPWATADRGFEEDQIERAETPLDRARRGLEALTGLGAEQITPALRKIIDAAVTQGYSASGAGGVEALPPGFQEAVAAARAQASTNALQAREAVARERAVPATAPLVQAPAVERDPAASNIPTTSASPTADAPEATTEAIAPTGPRTPAGPADSASAATLPAPSSPGAGDDVLGRLSLGQALVRALEGSGSVIAGRDLRSGTADTLGERMKQIEALRAKRQEQAFEQQRDSAKRLEELKAKREDRALELAREDKQSAALVEQLKSLAAQGLVPALEGLDQLPVKQAASLIKTFAGLPGTAARTDKTRAEIPLVQARTEGVRADTTLTGAKTKTEEDTRGARVGLLRAREDAARAQAEKLRQRAVVVKQASDTKAASDIRAAGNDARAAEKAITRAMETAETDKLGIAANIRDFQGLESVAPEFTRGVVPSWLGQGSISAARNVPATSKKAAELSSALETFIAGIRKSLFGASLTGNEKASFDAIVSSGLLMPPAVLAANINRLRAGAARFAQNHFTVAQALHPEVTGRVLKASSLFGPAVGDNGIYSDVWTLPKAPAPAVAGGAPAAPATSAKTITIQRKSDKKIKTVPAADRARWLANPEFEEVK